MPDIYDTPPAIAELARQAAAERARRYRAARREDGKPDTKAVDAAMSEAVSFLSSIAIPEIRAAGAEARATFVIDLADLHRMAVINLVRDGARRSYARAAVSGRIAKRTLHDQPHSMPSRRLTEHAAVIEKPVNNVWHDGEIGFVRKLVNRWRDAVNRA